MVAVEAGQTLTLAYTGILGGAVNDDGTIEIARKSTFNGAAVTIGIGGEVTVDSGQNLTLRGGAGVSGPGGGVIDITNLGTLETADTAGLTDVGIDNGFGVVRVDGGATLALDGTTVTGGTITDNGTIDVTGDSKVDGGAALTGGQVTVEDATLTLDDVTVDGTAIGGTSIDSVVQVDSGHTLTLVGGAAIGPGIVASDGTVVVGDAASLGFVYFGNNQLTVDGGATLSLFGATIDGGTITDNGTIEVNVDSTISNAELNGGAVMVDAGQTLTLNGDTVTGTTFDDTATGATIAIDATNALDSGRCDGQRRPIL